MNRYKPTKEEILAAREKTVPDVIADNLHVLFCGINPGLYSAAIGCHFGRPGNRFWKVLHLSGFTPRLFSPYDQYELLKLGYGVTNIVLRASAKADELSLEELLNGRILLEEKIFKYAPTLLAILGIDAYRKAFQRPKAKMGLQAEKIGQTNIFVLPNPSGLNAHYHAEEMVKLFTLLKRNF
jgi:double-stranded uracil-DNA glycosylase